MMKYHLLISLLFLMFINNAQAKNLGNIGATFEIGEIDMMVWIENRLRNFEESGKLDQMREEFTNRVQESYENPAPVDLSTTTSPTSYLVSANETFAKDVVDPTTGNVVVKSGTTINPFDPNSWPMSEKDRPLMHFELSKVLVFFDARDPQQITWAKQFKSEKPIKWILTGGSPNKASEILDSRIYFDQQGDITRRLNIQNVPSLAAQDGVQWRITEFDVSMFDEHREKTE